VRLNGLKEKKVQLLSSASHKNTPIINNKHTGNGRMIVFLSENESSPLGKRLNSSHE